MQVLIREALGLPYNLKFYLLLVLFTLISGIRSTVSAPRQNMQVTLERKHLPYFCVNSRMRSEPQYPSSLKEEPFSSFIPILVKDWILPKLQSYAFVVPLVIEKLDLGHCIGLS